MKDRTKKAITHVAIILLMLIVSCIYFLPLLQGKALPQGDLQSFQGMAKAQKDFHKASGEYTYWCPSMFSGMPGYQVTNSPQHSVFTVFRDVLPLGFCEHGNDIGVLFIYLLGFYVALVALGINPWLALVGGLAFGLGSYNIIIIEAGHITKAWAMSMMAPIIAGMLLCLNGAKIFPEDKRMAIGKWIWGGILFTCALGTQIAFNHIQITFYTVIACLIIGVVYTIFAIKDKYFLSFLRSVGVLVIGVVLALACNTRHLLVNKEYVKYTMRGGTEISVTPQDLYGKDFPKNNNTNDKGLDINYAFSWSYGIGETYTLLVPGSRGGGSGEKVGKDSESYKNLHIDRAPLYWGDQPFTSGPVYFGAIVVFLFIFGMIVVKGPERWWVLAVTIIAIIMAWGRNCIGINGWLFEHLPLYNKFRTPSMSLVLANTTMVLMAILGIREVCEQKIEPKKALRALFVSAGVTIGIILVGLVIHSGFSFSGSSDAEMAKQYGDQWPRLQDIFIQDREALFVSDSWRSIIFILLAGALLFLYIKKGLTSKKLTIPFIILIGILVVIDLQGVDSRYLSKDNYVRSKRMLEMKPSQFDNEIDALANQFGDKDYRVLTLATNTFNDSKPSAFHNQIGGYCAAKLRRYQDLIDFYLSNRINMGVINMLNTRYVVLQNGQVQRNPDALGNCWFVSDVKMVNDANEEILALNELDPSTTAVIDGSKFSRPTFSPDSTATIEMEHNKNVNRITYHSHCATEQLAVFSEIYYEPDWFVYIDGKRAEYMRANYVLRAMVVPAGDHTIEFRNEAPMVHRLDRVTLILSICTMLIIAGAIFFYYRSRKKTTTK